MNIDRGWVGQPELNLRRQEAGRVLSYPGIFEPLLVEKNEDDNQKEHSESVALGVVLLAVALLYSVYVVSIPYQDPPPELERQWREKAGIAEWIWGLGATVL